MKSSAANGWGGVGGKEQYKIELLPELVLKSSTGVWISQTHVRAGGALERSSKHLCHLNCSIKILCKIRDWLNAQFWPPWNSNYGSSANSTVQRADFKLRICLPNDSLTSFLFYKKSSFSLVLFSRKEIFSSFSLKLNSKPNLNLAERLQQAMSISLQIIWAYQMKIHGTCVTLTRHKFRPSCFRFTEYRATLFTEYRAT